MVLAPELPAVSLQALPKRIILAGRSRTKVQPVIDEINAINPSTIVDFVHVDLADNASVRDAALEIQSRTREVHALINVAGIMGLRSYTTSKDGIEIQFASNCVGHFLLTNLLVPEIKKAKGIVTNVDKWWLPAC